MGEAGGPAGFYSSCVASESRGCATCIYLLSRICLPKPILTNAALAARILSDPLTPTLICELAVGCELDLNINPDRLNDFPAFIDAGFIGRNRWQKMVVHWQHCHPTDDASEDRNIGAVVLAPGCGPRDILRLQGASVLATGP